MGHEERFPPTRLSAGCGFRKETIAGMRHNGRDAPIPDLPDLALERGSSDPVQTFGPAYEIETPAPLGLAGMQSVFSAASRRTISTEGFGKGRVATVLTRETALFIVGLVDTRRGSR
jgi:hypothetical protein